MPGTSDHGARKRRTGRDRTALWKRIGAFVRARREELGLSPGQIISVLGYWKAVMMEIERRAPSNPKDVIELMAH